MNVNKPVKISGVRFGNVLMNGAYVGSKTLEDVEKLAASASGAVVVGSISINPRNQNPGPGYWLHKERFYSLNSYGLPNGGLPYFKKNLPQMVKVAHAHSKPLIANLVGFSKEEFANLIKLAETSGADMAELNLGCPNVWEKGKQKKIISYDLPAIKSLLAHIARQSPKIPLSLKISPLPPDLLRDFAEIVTKSGIVKAVVATNSYPNASVSSGISNAEKQLGTLAGLAGRALKPISLGVVTQLNQLLPKDITIIGCGGISSINDVNDYLVAGAKAVQIATALVDKDPSVFENILSQAVRLS